MDRSFSEITDPKEVRQALSVLRRQLEQYLPHSEHRTIGFPSNYVEAKVRFQAARGEQILWWQRTLSEREGVEINRFGRGDPKGSESLMIDLQFNFSLTTFDRQHGGVFIRDHTTDDVWLAHRGIVTRGKSRVPRQLLIEEAALTYPPAFVDAKREVVVLPVAAIESSELVADLKDFCIELRGAAELAMQRHLGEKKHAKPAGRRTERGADTILQKLSDYFDEVTGRTPGYAHTVSGVDRRHGIVVRSLRDALSDMYTVKKNLRMDLVAMDIKHAFLFEVKTECSLTSLYTAVGQLAVNGLALKRCLPEHRVRKVIVLPEAARTTALATALGELDIQLQTYSLVSNGVTWHGLRQLIPSK
jgi:hypothetical protein